ncbi:hypothetical protein CRV08_08675 [Halarcobacter ebronensis]|uniref:Uncharacterized protein n=1 Tax=Halarcobacter ebronensis TaxID=1462615 RepID=A0A4Q0YE28_9BACT|nr:hypothetical protein [Halarcobacter ebronensis]RXJ68315.1 hypothetical protein CRV08_08675 [Halarcobacter ebronensis]
MKGKKGIVLLITLMFTLSISALILKNLDDSGKYINGTNIDNYYVKILISVDNLKEELVNYLFKHKKDLLNILEDERVKEGFDLNYGDIQSNISFKLYEDVYNINLLVENDFTKYKDIEELFLDNNVAGFDKFKNLVSITIKKYGEITNFKQIEVLLEEFASQMDNNSIMDIKQYLSFVGDENSNYVKCFLKVKYNDEISFSDFIIDLKAKNTRGFNIVFR